MSTGNIGVGHAVHLISLENHVFELHLDELRRILENDTIKDRYVIVVSIAGAFRKGKSFLLNFFLKYLYAKYKYHNMLDWIGEHYGSGSSPLNGFSWGGGQKPNTNGISMWSEIFTHDIPNGDKIAIIILDTQGIFGKRMSLRDNTTILALSILMSSVQCYNVMQNIQEDDLEFLTEYGRFAMQNSTETPFQKLLFIVRDWPYSNYGIGKSVIDEILKENNTQTPSMQQLRAQIKSTFNDINAFLLPYPGNKIANGTGTTMQDIDPQFIQYVKELVPLIFEPGNLPIKKINGAKVTAGDLVQYVQTFMNIFSGATLPTPVSMLNGIIETSYTILLDECLKFYDIQMQISTATIEPYVDEIRLMGIHMMQKRNAIAKFLAKPTLGDNQTATSKQQKLEQDIEAQFIKYKTEDEEKKKLYNEKINLEYSRILDECENFYDNELRTSIAQFPLFVSPKKLQEFHTNAKRKAMTKFNNIPKPGNIQMVMSQQVKFEDNIETRYNVEKDIQQKKHDDYMKTVGNWGYFGKLVKLDFTIGGTSHNEISKIYANSRHRIELIISVDIRDGDDNKLNVSNDELKEKLYFCDSVTGERISSPWSMHNDSNEYTAVTNTDTMTLSGTIRYIHKYISCSEFNASEHTKMFSVGINVPGIGEFDTSQNGTHTKNCKQGEPGSVFKSPKSLEIKAIHPIDYGVHGNVSIDVGEFVMISSNFTWVSKWSSYGPFKTHHDGKCKRRIVYIRPNPNKTGHDKFKNYVLRYDRVYNFELNDTTETFAFDGGDRIGFDLLRNDSSRPCAVIGWEGGESDYEMNMWYERKSSIRIDGDFYTEDNSYTYRFIADVKENHQNDDEDGAVSFLLYKFSFAENHIYNYRWHNMSSVVTVDVTDFYGNQGRFRVAFPDGKGKFNEIGLL